MGEPPPDLASERCSRPGCVVRAINHGAGGKACHAPRWRKVSPIIALTAVVVSSNDLAVTNTHGFVTLDQDLVLQLLRAWQATGAAESRTTLAAIIRVAITTLFIVHQLLLEYGLHKLGHKLLLLQRAVVLNRDDDRVRGGAEGVLVDGNNHIAKRYLACERVPVVDDGLSTGSVPAVNLHAAAATQETPDVRLNR